MNAAEAFAAIALAAIACDGVVDPHEAKLLRGLLDHRQPRVWSSSSRPSNIFPMLSSVRLT